MSAEVVYLRVGGNRSRSTEMMKAAQHCIALGFGALGYEWIYIPIVRWLGVEPWTLTDYGLSVIVFGFVIAAVVRVTRD